MGVLVSSVFFSTYSTTNVSVTRHSQCDHASIVNLA